MKPVLAIGSVLLAAISAFADFSGLEARRTASEEMPRVSESAYRRAPILEGAEPDSWLNGRLRREESCRECSAPQRERKMLEERLMKKRKRQESGGKR